MEEQFYSIFYESASIWSMRFVSKKAVLTNKEIRLRFAGPKTWHMFFIFLPFIKIIMWPAFVIWIIHGYLSKGEERIIRIKDLKSVEVDHPKFTLVYRVKLTEKDGRTYYFIPSKSRWSLVRKEFVEEFVNKIKKLM